MIHLCYPLLLALTLISALKAGELTLVQPVDSLPANFYEEPPAFSHATPVEHEPAVLIRSGTYVYEFEKTIEYTDSASLLAPLTKTIAQTIRTQKVNLTPQQQSTILARPGLRLTTLVLHSGGETYLVTILHYGKGTYYASISTSPAKLRYQGKDYYCINDQNNDKEFPNNLVTGTHLQALMLAHPEITKFANHLIKTKTSTLPDPQAPSILPPLSR